MNIDEHIAYTNKKMTVKKMDIQPTKELNYVETEFHDYVWNSFMMERIKNGANIFSKNLRIIKVPNAVNELYTFCEEEFSVNQFIQNGENAYIIGPDYIVRTRANSSNIRIEISGDKHYVDTAVANIHEKYHVVTTTIDWVTNMDMNVAEIPLIVPQGITNSSYPFIEEGVSDFVNDYLHSSENVLLLIGPPGTGKSNFIKYIIAESKRNAVVTYDPNVMKKDDIFAMFSEGDYGAMIMEDADAFLGARTEGNEMMHKFLNSSDGIVSTFGKKLIFSTNLESVDEIDPALLRPGRCFAVVTFRKLDQKESAAFVKEHGIDWEPTPGESYSLAQLYNHSKRGRTQNKRKVGFY